MLYGKISKLAVIFENVHVIFTRADGLLFSLKIERTLEM